LILLHIRTGKGAGKVSEMTNTTGIEDMTGLVEARFPFAGLGMHWGASWFADGLLLLQLKFLS
jgi:hypothetical protein